MGISLSIVQVVGDKRVSIDESRVRDRVKEVTSASEDKEMWKWKER